MVFERAQDLAGSGEMVLVKGSVTNLAWATGRRKVPIDQMKGRERGGRGQGREEQGL